jgi:hypothetical protein
MKNVNGCLPVNRGQWLIVNNKSAINKSDIRNYAL